MDNEIQELTSDFTSGILNISGIIYQETEDRITAINELSDNLTNEITARQNQVSGVHSGLQDETQARISGVLASQISGVYSGLQDETTQREESDNEIIGNLETEISTRESQVQELENNLETEIEQREQAIEELNQSLTSEVSTRESQVQELENNLETEAQQREDGDSGINNSLDTLIANINNWTTLNYTFAEGVSGNLVVKYNAFLNEFIVNMDGVKVNTVTIGMTIATLTISKPFSNYRTMASFDLDIIEGKGRIPLVANFYSNNSSNGSLVIYPSLENQFSGRVPSLDESSIYGQGRFYANL